MLLKKLSIHNFKSLRKVYFEPSPLSVIVGTNASGKTNFASAIHFLSEVYSLGLESAIARAGGYENIAYRKQRRSTAPIKFEVKLEPIEKKEFIFSFLHSSWQRFEHNFSVIASGTDIKANFKIQHEAFRIIIQSEKTRKTKEIFRYEKRQGEQPKIILDKETSQSYFINTLSNNIRGKRLETEFDSLFWMYAIKTGEQELAIANSPLMGEYSRFTKNISNFKVHQISPAIARNSGVPTPNPKLDARGENLPALVNWLQRTYPDRWETVMDGMRDIMMNLEDITVQPIWNNTLSLFFHEEGIGTPWNVNEISDGTIQALAMLVAAADPRNTLLVIEEPENSVHPWILRTIVKRMRELSQNKNVVLTTHSPVLIDMMRPEEVWVMYREKGESHLERLTKLDPTIQEKWTEGKTVLSSYLDAGFIGQAVPGGVF